MRLVAAQTALVLAACEPLQTTWETGSPEMDVEQDALVVSPAAIDFGSVSALGWGRLDVPFTVTNAGTGPIAVHGHDEVVVLSGEDAGAIFEVDAEPYFELLPGETRDLAVRFVPPTEGSWTGEIRVNYGIETLALSGEGRAPVTSVEVEGAPPAAFGCASEGRVRLHNVGNEPMRIDRLGVLDGTDWQVEARSNVELEPGGTLETPVVFQPAWTGAPGGARDTLLEFRTNDPLRPNLQVPLEGLAYEGALVVETFDYAPGIDADLLFVADTSGVMSAYVQFAEGALPAMLNAMDAGAVEQNLAALTTASNCPVSQPPWMTDRWSVVARTDLLMATLGGEAGTRNDRLIDYAADALSAGAATCLSGFLRPGAQLHVVVIAGRAEGSDRDADVLRALLEDVAPDAGEVVVSAVISTNSSDCGGVAYGAGYAELALSTGGEVVDLCGDDWAAGFERIGTGIALDGRGALTRPLDRQPLLESLRVKVDGVTFEGWTYDATANAVRFAEETAPDAGSAVEISYMNAVDCAADG